MSARTTEIDVQAENWWADPKGTKAPTWPWSPSPRTPPRAGSVEPARFGRISDGTAVLTVQAFGFPLFQAPGRPAGEGEQGVFRDFEQATGHAPVAANRRQGTLAVYLDDPPPARQRPGDPSPWEGMSGAAVWAAGRIVGVVAEHHSSEGTGRLTARRIDRAYEQLPGA